MCVHASLSVSLSLHVHVHNCICVHAYVFICLFWNGGRELRVGHVIFRWSDLNLTIPVG